ncbi:histone deacetylase HDT2-like isoform X1 [Panicum virgatum]|uniref:histone deacetylase HDT2-like isoform X1 n=1 Tax=Panicum virgatum TaxID=38727 RepID=UPI0019D5B0D1|nr:histone deacetylase HDT2-like isoform X1 [Panicum virgatum]
MEFWGLEVKPGTTVKCDPSDGYILHLSQAALGESKKSDTALMYVKVDDQKLAIGTLSHDKYPHIPFDLVFDKEFELSHTSKAASVFFSGYKVEQPGVEDEMDFDSEEDEDVGEEQNIPLIKENGKAQGKEEQKSKAGPAASNSSAAVKDVDKKIKADDDSDEDETDDDSDDDDLSPDEEGNDDDSSDEGDSSEEDEDSEDDEEEETPTPKKQPEVGKKRAAENALKTPVSDKKAKVATPSGQKTGGNKGTAHVPTPHPAKKVSKTPANNDKSKEKSPKSGGSVVCKSCSKTFNSDMALQAHSKAKHGAK